MHEPDLVLKHYVRKRSTPSVQYVIFNSHSVIHRFIHGMADIKHSIPVTPETSYCIFSITKTFTAVAILQLVQAGRIELDAPVINYLPGLSYGNKITVRQLLNHSAGIPNPIPLSWVHLASEHAGFDSKPFFDAIIAKHSQLKRKPGTGFSYSNLGYILLAWIIESVSGIAYEDFIARNILVPLEAGANNMGFDVTSKKQAIGYHKQWSLSGFLLRFLLDKRTLMEPTERGWQPFKPLYVNGAGYGGLVASADGLIKYVQALLSPNSLLFNPQTRSLLFTENFINSKATGMCLSFFTGNLQGHRYYGHPGGGGGYYTEMRIYEELGLGSLLLLNRTGMRHEKLLDKTDSYFLKKLG